MTKKRKNTDHVILNENEIIRLYTEEFLSIEDIRKIFNVNYATIRLRLVRNNIKLRTQSEAKKITMNKPEIKEKISTKSKETSKKRMKTTIEKYGTTVAANAKREEWQKEYIKKNGIEWHKDPKRTEKIKKTCIEKYGVDNVSKTEVVKEKIKNNRWKEKTEKELNNIKQKTIDTWKNNFGDDNPLKNEKIKKLSKKKRWDDKTEEEKKKILEKCKNTIKTKMLPFIKERLKKYNIELLQEFQNTTNVIKVKCLKCMNEFETVLDYIFHDYGFCPLCYPKNESKWELEIKQFLNELPIIIESKNKKILCGKELDIFIPEKNIAIECNGLYYHSDARSISPENYHLNKTLECQKKNIRLIHIFEDEWIFKKEIVKNRLKQIIGVQSSCRIYGRKCIIKEIDSKTKNEFLEKFHLQGKDISKVNLGAFYNDNLVSVMTFSKGNISKGSKAQEGVWELNRFCSDYNYQVIGIASKLLKYFQRNYKWKEIFSYADFRWSYGNLYKVLNFNLDKITRPNYWYTKGIKRIHRFNLRKRPDEPKHISEWTLRQNEGYNKIWDCGNLKFKLLNE